MDIEYNNMFHTNAKKILDEKKRLQAYISDCLEAGICPKCGTNKICVKYLHFAHTFSAKCSCGFRKNSD